MTPPSRNLPPRWALALPLGFIATLALFTLLPSASASDAVMRALLGGAAALFIWNAVLFANALRRRRALTIEVSSRPQHYLQACAQLSVFVYWGWWWRTVYDSADLILAQIVFAYAFDLLLSWSRRQRYVLGWGPFPIVLSTNLFLWFRPEWFHWQLVLVAVGLLAKELLRWERDGRRTHIFNPSSFPLALFSIILLCTGTGDHTYGRQIATTLFRPPHIYVWIFLIALPGQLLFGVTAMTLSAVVTTYAFSALYFVATGSYFFFDSNVPIAVFLGMQLLFTDPATSPRSELGRILFGVAYGGLVVFCYGLLSAISADTFYDKLLPVPFLNLSVRALERAARRLAMWPPLARFDPARLAGASLRRNLGYVGIWSVVFLALSATKGLGDTHPGNRLPFWEGACKQGRRNACANLGLMETKYCGEDLGWACNELGILVAESRFVSVSAPVGWFERSCVGGFFAGCNNWRNAVAGGNQFAHRPPLIGDYQRLLEAKGFPEATTRLQLLTNACDQGWRSACADLGLQNDSK